MCTSEGHEAAKEDPARLTTEFDEHAEPWEIAGEVLRLYTCRSCHSTVAVVVTP